MSFAYSPISLSANTGAAGAAGVGSGRITVGASGASYTSIGAAVSAGNYVLSVINNVTESGQVTVPTAGLEITIDATATLAMGTGNFLIGESNLQINGPGTISYQYSNVDTILFDSQPLGRLTIGTVTIDNNSSVPVCLTDTKYARIYDVLFDGAVDICGNSNVLEGCIYKNSTISVRQNITNTLIDGSIFDGTLVVDSGNNTVISDSVVY